MPMLSTTAAMYCRELKRHEEALASYDKVLAIKPDYVEALHDRGVVLQGLKRHEEALASYDKALAIRPDYVEALHDRGVVLRELKRHEEALASYDKALAIKPDHADALNNRGIVLQGLKRHEEALASYDKALAIRPDYVEALNNRGFVLRELKRHEEALASYDKALAIKPDYADVLNNRGIVLQGLKRHEEALASYDKALALRPDHADALNNRGVVLQGLKRHEEALASYDKVLAIKPDYADALNNRGIVLTELGHFNEARVFVEEAIKLAPRNAKYYFSLIQLKQFSANDPHLAAMEELARDMASLSEEDQIRLHFAMSKALAGLEQHERSFHHLLQGNALNRQQITYDETETLRHFARIEAVFTAKLMHDKQGLGDPSLLPVFIVGMPRSGTTLIEQILASHPKVFGAGELANFGKGLESVNNVNGVPMLFPEMVPAMFAEQLRQLGATYLKSIRTMAPEAERITDKMPVNFMYAGLIHLALPNARIIHAQRDPVDTALSCFSILFTEGQPYSYDLGELGRYYRAYQALMEHWRKVVPAGVMLEVQYEDVVDDLEGQARRIVAHCGLEWDDACVAFHKTQRIVQTASTVQVRQPIYQSSVGRWHPYKDQLRPLLEALDIDKRPQKTAMDKASQ
jgi:tetratricopeptide (TPR) repeat protein